MRVAEAGTFHHIIIKARTCLNLLLHLQLGLAPATSSGRLCPKEAARGGLALPLLLLTPSSNNPNRIKFLFHRFLHFNNLPKAHHSSKAHSITPSRADLGQSMVIKDPINRVWTAEVFLLSKCAVFLTFLVIVRLPTASSPIDISRAKYQTKGQTPAGWNSSAPRTSRISGAQPRFPACCSP